MTFVDENLLGTGSIRSAKSGAKATGKFNDSGLAGQRAAFETAFADAGKKKQPVVSIDAKPIAETGLKAQKAADIDITQPRISDPKSDEPGIAELRIAEPRSDALRIAEPRTTDPRSEKPGSDAKVPRKDGDTNVPGRDVGRVENAEPLFAQTTDQKKSVAKTSAAPFPDAAGPADVPQGASNAENDGIQPKTEVDQSKDNVKLTDTPQAVSFVKAGKNATVDAGTIVNPSASEKIAELLNAHVAHLAKHTDPKAANKDISDETSSSEPQISAETTTADVSQLLTLLDAAQTPAAAVAARSETTPAMSEFQALADRAGKTKAASTDGQAAKAAARIESDQHAIRNATQAGSDQVFRFARADGKGQAVSLNIKADGDKSVVNKETPATNAKAETVTVLEARRYLGLAPASNAAAVTSQIISNPEWAKTLQSTAAAEAPLTQAATGKVLNTLKIQMHPIDLGTVTATLRLKDDELHVELKVETGDAFRQLSDDQNAMVKALRAQGFAVDQVSIVFNAPDSSGSNAQQQTQSQTGQQGREAAGDGQAQSRGQSNDNGARGQSRERLTGNDGTSGASLGSELDSGGDVYM